MHNAVASHHDDKEAALDYLKQPLYLCITTPITSNLVYAHRRAIACYGSTVNINEVTYNGQRTAMG